jgi:magnesium chelatase subunit D
VTQPQLDRWQDACLIAQLIAIDPQGLGGVWLQSSAGPVREQWLTILQEQIAGRMPLRKISPQTDEFALLGGVDIFQTLQKQQKVFSPGILEQAHGGLILLSMAERLVTSSAALITQAMDQQQTFGVIAVDESIPGEEEPLIARLQDRLAFKIHLDDLSYFHCIFDQAPIDLVKTRSLLRGIDVPEVALEAIITAAHGLGIHSLRAIRFALQASRVIAALRGSTLLDKEDIRLATRLVFSHRITRLPKDMSDEEESISDDVMPEEPPEASQTDPENDTNAVDEQESPSISREQLEDMIIEASKASLPADLLDTIRAGKNHTVAKHQQQGKFGEQKKGAQRGLRLPSRQLKFDQSKKIDLLKTIQAAIPWQVIRKDHLKNSATTMQLKIYAQDIYLQQFMQRTPTVTLFVVDASGSSAKERLSEAKGAVELLLAQCYIRRDQVAMMTFRANKVDLALAPTRSLVRAKRLLAAMPGGGGTPLAKAMQQSTLLAKDLRRKGQTPLVVIMTDGRANVSLAGIGGREQAYQDCLLVAKQIVRDDLQILFIDTSFKAQDTNQIIAQEMNATYLLLPQGKSSAVAQAAQKLLV